MKIQSIASAFTCKIILAISCVAITSAGFSKCYAQSIIGKWNGVSVKNYFSAEYAKVKGKPMEEKSAKETGSSTIEYKADHTFIMTFSDLQSPEIITMQGTWSLAGDQLRSTLEPKYNPRNITTNAVVTISGNTIVTTAIIPPPSRISKTIATGTRM
jgi:hypothetical protein